VAHPVPPYGQAIHEAIATGDVSRMRETLRRAQEWIAEHDDLRMAVEVLKAEIARKEAVRP
jgi:hypothetical protein